MSDTGNYPNRSDLRNPAKRVVSGQTYGKGKQQMDAQRAVPMGRSPVEAAVSQRPMPGTLGALTRPSERPAEPITAGADFGPGVNAAGAGIPMMRSPQASALAELRSIAQMTGSETLQQLLESYGSDYQ
jgi:hypothetical protein